MKKKVKDLEKVITETPFGRPKLKGKAMTLHKNCVEIKLWS